MGLKRSLMNIEGRLVDKLRGSYFGRRFTRSSIYTLIKERGLELLYLFILFTMMSGVVNTILEGSKPEYLGIPILTTRAAQTWSEAVMNFFIVAFGTAGLYLIYVSGKQAVRRRIAGLYLLLGLTLLIVAIFVGLYILDIKR